jgi:tRNA dimethylallyltransferase
MPSKLITILGPTATGKTGLAAKLAYKFNGEIISADSRQVYKRMDIGTGKDLNEYIINNTSIPHHLIDIIEPSEEYNLFLFLQNFNKIFKEISEKGRLPFLVGGTGLFLSAVLQRYELTKADLDEKRKNILFQKDREELKKILLSINPSLHNTTDLLKKERIISAIIIAESSAEKVISVPKIHSINIGIRLHRDVIKKRITERLRARLDQGMINEVKGLINSGITFDKLNFFGLEYKYIGKFLNNEINYNDMFQKLNSAIHNFAKRQMTWFRKMEKEGVEINWIEGPDENKAEETIRKN